jgi:hypothetical protein
MNIHFIENKKIKSKDVTLVFFNKNNEHDYEPKYVDMINTSPIIKQDNYINIWVLKDKYGNEYKLRKLTLNIIKDTNKATIKEHMLTTIMIKKNFTLFLKNNKFPVSTVITDEFVRTYISHLDIYSKITNIPLITWNITKILKSIYSSIIIVDNNIVGTVKCNILTDKESKEHLNINNILYPNMKLYISNVDIRDDYQGLSLCKPLLSYMIKQLKILGHEQLFIENVSRTKGGVPACICYYRAGINNNYKMRYRSNYTIKKMDEKDCHIKPIPTSYYYMSDAILNRGYNKFKKGTNKIKKYLGAIRPRSHSSSRYRSPSSSRYRSPSSSRYRRPSRASSW